MRALGGAVSHPLRRNLTSHHNLNLAQASRLDELRPLGRLRFHVRMTTLRQCAVPFAVLLLAPLVSRKAASPSPHSEVLSVVWGNQSCNRAAIKS